MRSAFEYLITGLIFLGVIIVYATLRADNFNIYILGTGVLLIVIPVAGYFVIERIRAKEMPKARSLTELKVTGIKVTVDLTKCIIKSNSWTTETERYDSPRVAFLNEVSGNSDKNVEMVDSNISGIEYSCDFNGEPRTFRSPTIARDKTTLMLLLEIQKETAIYVDRDDSTYYYFDLEFIDQDTSQA